MVRFDKTRAGVGMVSQGASFQLLILEHRGSNAVPNFVQFVGLYRCLVAFHTVTEVNSRRVVLRVQCLKALGMLQSDESPKPGLFLHLLTSTQTITHRNLPAYYALRRD